jgi:hypothetical protein
MKVSFLFCALFISGLSTYAKAPLPNGSPVTFTVTGEVIEVKRSAVSAFLRPVQPNKRQNALSSPFLATDTQQLYDAVQRTTAISSKRLPEVQTKNNQRQFKKIGDSSLEVEPFLDADGHTLRANLVVSIAQKSVAQSISGKDSENIFAGSLEGGTPETIRLVFIELRKR